MQNPQAPFYNRCIQTMRENKRVTFGAALAALGFALCVPGIVLLVKDKKAYGLLSMGLCLAITGIMIRAAPQGRAEPSTELTQRLV
ncbi:MAG: hypothetical protein K0Q57_554 [Gammaproteobacteria bacterium]|jgi:hypothetical protein|nr:hypothetical protein [Gammaproteobacteria bacterium]